MSNHVTLEKLGPEFASSAAKKGWHWYVLKDLNGKVRDWTAAPDAIIAFVIFTVTRRVALPWGYRAEKRGLVRGDNNV